MSAQPEVLQHFQRERSQTIRAAILAAVGELDRAGQQVRRRGVARKAGVDRSYLYEHPELLEQIRAPRTASCAGCSSAALASSGARARRAAATAAVLSSEPPVASSTRCLRGEWNAHRRSGFFDRPASAKEEAEPHDRRTRGSDRPHRGARRGLSPMASPAGMATAIIAPAASTGKASRAASGSGTGSNSER